MKKLALVTVLFAFVSVATSQNIRYVTQNGIGDGTSWADASNDIQAMMDSLKATGGEVWVAEGIYTPLYKLADTTLNGAITTDRDKAFLLVKDVKIYGGFIGTETELSQRDWETYLTVLSGDIDIEGDSTYNCYHVVVSSGDIGVACLDGFTITGGNASGNDTIKVNGYDVLQHVGGGMHTAYSSLTIINSSISANAANFGGGMHNRYSSVILVNTSISNNLSSRSGAGIYNGYSSVKLTHVTMANNIISGDGNGGGMANNASTIEVIHCSFWANSANYGGGIFSLESSVTLTNVEFLHNSTSMYGGGIYNAYSNAVLTNVIISENTTDHGGGVFNFGSSPILTNTTIVGNSAASRGGGMVNTDNSFPEIRNSIIWGNGDDNILNNKNSDPSYLYSLVEHENPNGRGNINGTNVNNAPVFVDVANRNYNLVLGSRGIEEGSSSFYNSDSIPNLSLINTDMDGNPRLVGTTVDMGAYEFQNVSIASNEIKSNIIFFPNPAQHTLYIESSETVEQVSIYDISGRMLNNTVIATNEANPPLKGGRGDVPTNIDISHLTIGIYLVKVKTAQGETAKKIVKQ